MTAATASFAFPRISPRFASLLRVCAKSLTALRLASRNICMFTASYTVNGKGKLNI
jgi:hypothetical protein